MSKCGINRMKAGGRCAPGGGSRDGGGHKDTQLDKDFNSLLAQRAALDSQMATPVPTKNTDSYQGYSSVPTKGTMPLSNPKQNATPALTPMKTKADLIRQKLIDQILNGEG